eukprot:9111039-Pyramimonas_sp.AAC.1
MGFPEAAGAPPQPQGAKFAAITLRVENFEQGPTASGSSMLSEYIRSHFRSSHVPSTRGREGNII